MLLAQFSKAVASSCERLGKIEVCTCCSWGV